VASCKGRRPCFAINAEVVALNVDTVEQDTRQFIVETFLAKQDEGQLAEDASLLGEGIVDSTGILELIEHLEKTYGITVLDEEMTADNLDSIAKIAEFVRRKTGA